MPLIIDAVDAATTATTRMLRRYDDACCKAYDAIAADSRYMPASCCIC